MKTNEPFFAVSIEDYDYAEIDVVKVGREYSTVIYFYDSADDWDNEPNQAKFALDTPIKADTLKEVFERIEHLFESGLFDTLKVNTQGAVWNDNGEIIDTISWMAEGGYDDENLRYSYTSPTIH